MRSSAVQGLVVVRVLPLHRRALLKSSIKGPADDKSAHFAGACPDLVELGVAQEAPHGIVVDVTVPTCSQGEATSDFSSLMSEAGVGRERALLPRKSLPVTYPDTESHPGPPG